MKLNKVLGIQAFFQLPDDFKGTTADALREFAHYHETEGLSNPHREIQDGSTNNTWQELWDKFLITIRGGKKRCVSFMCISQLKDGDWVKLVDFKNEKPIIDETL